MPPEDALTNSNHLRDGTSNAFLQCLQANRARLTTRCRAVLESHGV